MLCRDCLPYCHIEQMNSELTCDRCSVITPHSSLPFLIECTDEQGLKAEKEKITLRVQATRNDKLKEAVMAAGNDHQSTVTATGM